MKNFAQVVQDNIHRFSVDAAVNNEVWLHWSIAGASVFAFLPASLARSLAKALIDAADAAESAEGQS